MLYFQMRFLFGQLFWQLGFCHDEQNLFRTQGKNCSIFLLFAHDITFPFMSKSLESLCNNVFWKEGPSPGHTRAAAFYLFLFVKSFSD